MNRLTLADIEAIDRETLSPAQVASVLGVDQDTLRGQARSAPELLRFPTVCVGNRVRIPKQAFLNFMKGESIGTKN